MQDLINQLNTLIADAQTALTTAQATAPPPPSDPNDAIVTAVVAAFTNAGYTVTPPNVTPIADETAAETETPAEDATETTEG